MRVQSVVLENHGDVAVLWWNVSDIAVTNEDATAVDLFEACEHAQGSGLTATRRSDKYEEFAVFNLEVDLVYRGLGGAGVEASGVIKCNCSHDFYCSFTGRYVPDDPL